MTDETQEPRMGDSKPQELPVSQEQAEKMVGRMHEIDKAMAQDPEFLKLMIGKAIYSQEFTGFTVQIYKEMKAGGEPRAHLANQRNLTLKQIEDYSSGAKKDIEKRQRQQSFFIDLLKGVPLVEAIRTSIDNYEFTTQDARNTGMVLKMYREEQLAPRQSQTSQRFKDCLGTISGGVEYSFRFNIEERGAENDEVRELWRLAKDRALVRAKKLDEELGQK